MASNPIVTAAFLLSLLVVARADSLGMGFALNLVTCSLVHRWNAVHATQLASCKLVGTKGHESVSGMRRALLSCVPLILPRLLQIFCFESDAKRNSTV